MLYRRGVVDIDQIRKIHIEFRERFHDDPVHTDEVIGVPRPLLHFVMAAILFRRIAGVTPDSFLQERRIQKTASHKLHGMFYAHMLEKATLATREQLGRRLESVGLSWSPVCENLTKRPKSIPCGHCVTYMKHIMNGLLTSARLRFRPDAVVEACPFCGILGYLAAWVGWD